MARICILHPPRRGNAPVCLPGDLTHRALGGTESGTIHLASALAARGHRVDVVYGGDELDHRGVAWRAVARPVRYDLAIVNRWARFFDRVEATRKAVWMHNTVNLIWSLSRRDFPAIVRHRPVAVVLSRHQEGRLSRLLPYSGRVLIRHGVAADFLECGTRRTPPPPTAIWASQPYRNLDWTLDVWRRLIRPAVPEARLHVHEPGGLLTRGDRGDGIIVAGSMTEWELAQAFGRARVLLYPGHGNETFCNVAAQATCCGTPTVTRGIGCLPERVEHGNGIVARSRGAFADSAIRLLTDDEEWARLHARTNDHPDRRSWDACAADWEAAFL